jgi:type I restriction enzyme S subunit
MVEWETKTLGEVGKIFSGNSIPVKIKKEKYLGLETGLPFIATKDIDYPTNKINFENGVKIPVNEPKFKLGHKNSILICGEGGSAGKKLAFLEKDVYFGNKLIILEPHNFIQAKLIYYYYLTDKFSKNFKENLTGLIGGITQKDFKNLEIKFPTSIEEQKRIVKKLDTAFENIDKTIELTRKNLNNSKEVFESYLNNVFSTSRAGWEEKRLGEITTKIGSGSTPRGGQSSYKSEGISLIRSMNVHDRFFKIRKLAFIDDDQAKKLNNVTIQKDDILLNITGASVARCCKVDENYLPARVNQHVSIIRFDLNNYSPAFFSYLLTSEYYKKMLLIVGVGSTRESITKQQIQDFKISFPTSLKEQEQIVSKLDELQENTKKLEKVYSDKIELLSDLKKSILEQAFNGEL